jgi:hypothetical protein
VCVCARVCVPDSRCNEQPAVGCLRHGNDVCRILPAVSACVRVPSPLLSPDKAHRLTSRSRNGQEPISHDARESCSAHVHIHALVTLRSL